MYQIECTNFGFRLTFGGLMDADEMQRWVNETQTALANVNDPFHVFVDMRTLKTLPPDARAIMEKGQKLYKEKGMIRSVVIVDNATTKLQFVLIATKSGIFEWERYVSTAQKPNWEEVGLRWLLEEVDPDQN